MNKKLFVLSALSCALSPQLGFAQSGQGNGSGTDRASDLEEVIVTGYSTSEAAEVTGAIASIELEEIEDLSSGNVMQNLQGRVPGLQITTTGNPSSTATVRIRGQGLGPLGFNDPLYVIDGVPTISGMHELNGNDIESMQVLRDAAAASIYGARAGNGVIVITTKQGSGEPRFDFKLNQSWEDFDYDLNPLSTQGRARAVFQAAINDRTNPNSASPLYNYDWNGDFDNPQLNGITYPEYLDAAQTMQPANTRWFDEITQVAKTTDIHASLSTGSDRSRLYSSFGYIDREGVVDSSRFKRLSFRLNSSMDFKDGDITVGENFTITDQTANLVNDLAQQALGLSIEQQSIVPIHTIDGQGWGGPAPGITDRDNPVRLIEMNDDNENTYNRVMGNVYVEYRPIDGLTLRSNLGVNYGQFYFRNYMRDYQAGSLSFEDQLTTNHNWNETIVWSNTAEYDWYIQDHNINILAGTETVDFKTEGFSGSAQGFASDDRGFAFLDQGTSSAAAGGYGDAWSLQSYFTKVDYDYQGKYLASVTLRRDGSSRFGENNRWGNFPAVSTGWIISDEGWFDVNGIDMLKFRASWGETGNQEIATGATSTIYVPRYSSTSLFTNQQDEGTAYDLNGNDQGDLPSGFARVQTGNPDLKWETSTQTNVGIDFDLFDYHLYGSFDWFEKETTDILTATQPLATEGEGAQRIVNGGTIANTGYELVLGYTDEFEFDGIGVIGLDISGNVSTAENEVVDLPAAVVNSFPGNGRDMTILGRSVNSVYGYVTDGLFQSHEEVAAHADQAGAAPGRIRYVDLSGDGVINEEDQTFFATTDPDYIYGLNTTITYKNWDFNMFWQGVSGGQVRNGWRYFTDFTSLNAGSNYGDRVLSAWTPDNADSDVPALTLIDNNNEARQSTFYWESASYLKLRNLSVGYNPPASFWEIIGASSGRIYLAAQNLVTITPDGTLSQDPEAPDGVYPIPRRINIGFHLTF